MSSGVTATRLVLVSLVAATSIAAMPAAAQDTGSRPTREFVEAAGQSDAFEMLEAQTALTQSADPQVRAYAQHMLRDHGETSRTLQQATARSGLKPPPMSMSDEQAKLLGALQSLKGRDFDQAYFRHQALGHHSALTVEQRYAASGDDAAIRRVAIAATPVISAHLTEAERLQAATGAP